jgi:transporter family protein
MALSIGIIFALAAAVLNAGVALNARVAMRRVNDVTGWGFCYQLLAGVVYLFPAILLLSLPSQPLPYLFMLISGVLWTVYVFLSWSSHQHTPTSIRQTVNATKNIFVILAAFVLLNEAITLPRIAGSLLIIGGVAVISYQKKFQIEKGTLLTLGSAVTQAVARVFDKMAIPYFNTPTYAAAQYFLPAIGIGITQKGLLERVRVILKGHWRIMGFAVLLAVSTAYFQFESYRYLDVTVAVMIMELSTVFATIGGIVLLKERENVPRKLIGAIVVVLGVYIIAAL